MVRLTVRVTPRGGRDAIEGFTVDGELRVRVAAAPADGAANESVCRLIARALGISPSRVSIAAGAGSRTKVIAIDGLDQTAIRTQFEALP